MCCFARRFNQHLLSLHTVVRLKRVREKYEAELRELERSERAALEKQQELRKQQVEMEAELIRLQAALRQKQQENEDIAQVRSKPHRLSSVFLPFCYSSSSHLQKEKKCIPNNTKDTHSISI